MWSSNDPHFNIDQFVEHCRVTKPPFTCPYHGCTNKPTVLKSLKGLDSHLKRFHAYTGADEPDEDRENVHSPQAIRGGGGGVILSWEQAQRFVDIHFNDNVKRLNINQPLTFVNTQNDAQAKLEADEIEAKWKMMIAEEVSKGELPVAKFNALDVKGKVKITLPTEYVKYKKPSTKELDKRIEYHMDDEDRHWLESINSERKKSEEIFPVLFEYVMDRLEKECEFQTTQSQIVDDDAKCAVCLDKDCENTNQMIFCDMCNVAVHQECYGVPHVPAGTWLCRRCQLSPSEPVDCILCPNGGFGAFKQTGDQRWVHVNCAIWVPEVYFANSVFLEPVEAVDNIPAARYKLRCMICKKKHAGACIQCQKQCCYTAYHVTCAQSAGIYMKFEEMPRNDSNLVSPPPLRKYTYCDLHAPDSHFLPNRSDDEGSPMRKLFSSPVKKKAPPVSQAERKEIQNKRIKKGRKAITQKARLGHNNAINVPIISKAKAEEIATHIIVPSKAEFMKKLISYWYLKRKSRAGVPLLRRLQVYYHQRQVARHVQNLMGSPTTSGNVQQQARKVHNVRMQLESIRLIVELIKKREKFKRELTESTANLFQVTSAGLQGILNQCILELENKDRHYKIFHYPVTDEMVPGYTTIIEQPMDLKTMRQKIDNKGYRNIASFQHDFDLMIRNCLKFNKNNPFYYKAGQRMKRMGTKIIEQHRLLFDGNAKLVDQFKDWYLADNKNTLMMLTRQQFDDRSKLDTFIDVINDLNIKTTKDKKLPHNLKSSIKKVKKESKIDEFVTPKTTQKHVTIKEKQGMSFKQTKMSQFLNEQKSSKYPNSKMKLPPEKKRKLMPASRLLFRDYDAVKSPQSGLNSDPNTTTTDDETGSRRSMRRRFENIASPSAFLTGFQHLDVAWAKSPIANSLIPAAVIDPLQHHDGDYDISSPPSLVMSKQPKNATIPWVLLAFFDNGHNWDWVSTAEIIQFGMEKTIDEKKVRDCRKPDKMHVESAYIRALAWRHRHFNMPPPDEWRDKVEDFANKTEKSARCSLQ